MGNKIFIPKAIVYSEIHNLSKENLYKKAQGAPVLIFEKEHSDKEIGVALKILAGISPEVVIKKRSGEYEIIFSFYDELVVRPNFIN